MRNFLPFVRHAKVTFPAYVAGSLYKPIRLATNVGDLGTGGFIRAYLQDAIICTDPATDYSGISVDRLKMRFGIHGAAYFTEGFYEVRAYEDGTWPTYAVWNWKKPYRIYPKEFLRARIGTTGGRGTRGEIWPLGAAILHGVRVEDQRPAMLYSVSVQERETGRVIIDQILDDLQLDCPIDSAVDLYSISLNMLEADSFGIAYPRRFDLYDHNDRAICTKQDIRGWIQLRSTPINLGDDFVLQPGETITFEFQPREFEAADPVVVEVILRGVLEVEDGR